MSLLTVRHVTTYRYRHPVAFGEHRMMFRPRDSEDQRLLSHTLVITPEPIDLHWSFDALGNAVTLARFAGRDDRLVFESTLRVQHTEVSAFATMIADHAQILPFTYDSHEMPDLLRAIERQMPDPGHVVNRWAHEFLDQHGPTGTADLLIRMTKEIHRRFTYRARHEPGIQNPRDTLRTETGTCRDYALLMMEAVRSLGLAARFVSGYLHVPTRQRPGAERHGGGNTHAWVQVYLPGAGWVEFDPTNGIVGTRGLIRVASVRDPAAAIPLSGSWSGAAGDCLGMDVSVLVTETSPIAAVS